MIGARNAVRDAISGSARVIGLTVIGLSLIAVGPVAAQSPAASPASMATPVPMASAMPGAAVAVTLADFSVSPNPIEVTGLTVTLDVTNAGITPHNLTIRDAAGTVLGYTETMSQGGEQPLTLTLPGPGTYITFCSLPGHESLGLKGELIVIADAPASPGSSPAPSSSASPVP